MRDANYGKVAWWLIGAWFVIALAASALHVFQANPSTPPVALGLAAVLPVVIFYLWFAGSAGFREFVLSLNPQTVTLAHAWRTAGFAFVALYAYGILPGFFALPAGWGDIAIGVTAPLVAMKFAKPGKRGIFILWNALGLLDLVNALSLGAAAQWIQPHGIPTSAVTVLPMSLIPTFGVPLLAILHIISLKQARRWVGQAGAAEFALPSSAGAVLRSESIEAR